MARSTIYSKPHWDPSSWDFPDVIQRNVIYSRHGIAAVLDIYITISASAEMFPICKSVYCPSRLGGSHTKIHWELLLHARHHPPWLYLCWCIMYSVPTITMVPALMLSRQALNVNESIKCSCPGCKNKNTIVAPASRSSISKWDGFSGFKSYDGG